MSIASYVGWPTYDTFFIVFLSGWSVYDPNSLRSNPNPQKPVSCSRVGSNIDTPNYNWFLFFAYIVFILESYLN